MSAEGQVYDFSDPQFQVNKVEATRALDWLRAGWDDLNHHRGASIAHGLLVTGLGFVILLFATTHIYFMAAAISGFLLIGPVIATGLCELSRRRARGESEGFDESLDALARNSSALWHFGGMLLAISLAWFVVSVLILQAMLGEAAPSLAETVWGDIFVALTPLQAGFYLATGGLLALLVFYLSVVSVPAIIDRSLTASAAMRMSMRAFAANLPTMAVWGVLIVGLTAIGFLTFLLGLIVIYPLLGHATWYAYRDLVD